MLLTAQLPSPVSQASLRTTRTSAVHVPCARAASAASSLTVSKFTSLTAQIHREDGSCNMLYTEAKQTQSLLQSAENAHHHNSHVEHNLSELLLELPVGKVPVMMKCM